MDMNKGVSKVISGIPKEGLPSRAAQKELKLIAESVRSSDSAKEINRAIQARKLEKAKNR